MTEPIVPYPPSNPYQTWTTKNTAPEWLQDHEPLEVHIDGLIDYAKSLGKIADNLIADRNHVNGLQSLAEEA